MKILIAADIFGDTPELRASASVICTNFSVVSPYKDNPPQFKNENQAYAAFQACGGVEAYADKLVQQICSYQPDALIGFSVGSTASWLALSEEICCTVKLGILFYGSRIRDYLHLRPQCEIRLIFAEHEQSFDPKQLASNLRATGMTVKICADSQHGFMNRLSTGYDLSAEKMGTELTKFALSELGVLN